MGKFRKKWKRYWKNSRGTPREALLAAVLSLPVAIPMLWMPLRYPELTYEEATPVSGYLESCKVNYSDGRIKDIGLKMADGESYYLSWGCATEELAQTLSKLPKPAEVNLLLHPKGRDVMEIQVGSETLLEFDRAQWLLRREAVLFGWFGAFLLTVGGGMAGWAAWLKFGPSPEKKKVERKR